MKVTRVAYLHLAFDDCIKVGAYEKDDIFQEKLNRLSDYFALNLSILLFIQE